MKILMENKQNKMALLNIELLSLLKHELTPWESLEGTKRNYCFLLVPGKDGVKYRRYVCLFCSNCRDLKFL